MVDIRTNLLKNRQTLSEKDYQKERRFLRYSVFFVIVGGIVVVALSMWNLVLTKRLSEIEQSITKMSQEMQGLTNASAAQIYLKSRLKLITEFLTQRVVARESLQKVLSTSIEGSHITAVTLEDESTISISYGADSVVALERLLSYYEGESEYFTQVVSKGITRMKDGEYQLALALTLPNKGGK